MDIANKIDKYCEIEVFDCGCNSNFISISDIRSDEQSIKKETLYYVDFDFDRFLIKVNAVFDSSKDVVWIE